VGSTWLGNGSAGIKGIYSYTGVLSAAQGIPTTTITYASIASGATIDNVKILSCQLGNASANSTVWYEVAKDDITQTATGAMLQSLVIRINAPAGAGALQYRLLIMVMA